MNTVAHVLNPEFPRSWPEAVAIVQEVASQLHSGLAVPAPEDLVLDEGGRMVFAFASESSANPVTALGGLLQGLLNGVEAPAALRDLAKENSGASPAHATVAGFSRALAFFERPNRASDLAAVAGRLGAFTPKLNPEQEFERLREKVARGDEDSEKPAEKPRRDKPRLTKRQQAIVAVAILILLPGGMAVQFGAPGGLRMGSMIGDDGLGGLVSAALGRLGISNRTEAAPADVREVPLPVEAVSKPGEPKAASKTQRTAPVAAAQSTIGSRQTPAEAVGNRGRVAPVAPAPPLAPVTPTAERSVAAAPPSAAAVREAARTETTGLLALLPGLVYTTEHEDVVPPSLMRPQLPKEPAPGSETGYFDLLIDETGSVEQVKLFSPARRFQDRMLVAAAKAWKFNPATRHGEPVKYRVRVPIILPQGMP